MSGSLNKVTLIGRLGRDPETRAFPDGRRVVTFSLATSESWRDKQTGERKQRVEWHNIAVFNESLGKIVESYCKKGATIYLEGALRTREYGDRDGVKRKTTEIVLANFKGDITLLDTRQDKNAEGGQAMDQAPAQRAARGDAQALEGLAPDLDDDIPF